MHDFLTRMQFSSATALKLNSNDGRLSKRKPAIFSEVFLFSSKRTEGSLKLELLKIGNTKDLENTWIGISNILTKFSF